jgi:hypothetical protein
VKVFCGSLLVLGVGEDLQPARRKTRRLERRLETISLRDTGDLLLNDNG